MTLKVDNGQTAGTGGKRAFVERRDLIEKRAFKAETVRVETAHLRRSRLTALDPSVLRNGPYERAESARKQSFA